MKASLLRRLATVGRAYSVANRQIVVHQYFDETDRDVIAKIARWNAGETVRDVRVHPICGDEMLVVLRCFAQKRDGSVVTTEEYSDWVAAGGTAAL